MSGPHRPGVDLILGSADLAEVLSVPRHVIASLVARGMPAVVLPDGARRFVLSDVVAWLRTAAATQPPCTGCGACRRGLS